MQISDIKALAAALRLRYTPIRKPALQMGVMCVQGLSNGTTDLSGTCCVAFKTTVACHDPEFVWRNSYMSNGTAGETVGLNPITINATLEYPNDTFYPLTFSGKKTASVEAGGWARNDPVGVSIPAGTLFYVRSYVLVTTGQKFPLGALGVASVASRAGVNYPSVVSGAGTDQTAAAGTAWRSGSNNYGYGPEFAGATPDGNVDVPVVGLVGDSILLGQNDAPLATGFAAYQLNAAGIGYHKLANAGDTAQAFATATKSPFRQAMIDACTDVVVQYGTNDFAGSSRTDAQVQADLATIGNWITARGCRAWLTTVLPRTTSTDSWATAGNQTPLASEANRTANNTWRRSVPAPYSGCFDVCANVEVNSSNVLTRGGGRWISSGSAFTFCDNAGTHPSHAAVLLIAPSLTTSRFTVAVGTYSTGSSA